MDRTTYSACRGVGVLKGAKLRFFVFKTLKKTLEPKKNLFISYVMVLRGGSRGRVHAGGVYPLPSPLRGILTTGILQNMQICVICIFSSSYYVIA